MKLIIGASVFLLASVTIFIVIKFSDVEESEAFVEGDFRSSDSGYWDDEEIWEMYDGDEWVQSSTSPMKDGSVIIIDSGHVVLLEEEVRLSKLIVLPGAEVRLMTNAIRIDKFKGEGFMKVDGVADLGDCIVEGNADFTIGAGGTLKIGSPYGLSKSGKTGNLQLKGKYYFNEDAEYIYNGTLIQETGTGLPVTIRRLTIDNFEGVNLSSDIRITELIDLANGILFTGDHSVSVGEKPEDKAQLVYSKGAVCGELRYMTHLDTKKNLSIPLSDGYSGMEMVLDISDPKLDDGYVVVKYYPGSVITDDRSPFEASERIVGITSNGFFTSKATQGLKDAVYVSRGLKVNKDGGPISNWSIVDFRTLNKQEDEKGGDEQFIYNIVYGPNPLQKVFYLKFDSYTDGLLMISLMDASGNEVVNESIEMTQGSNTWKYNCGPDMESGNYFLRLSTSSEIHSFLLTKGLLPG